MSAAAALSLVLAGCAETDPPDDALVTNGPTVTAAPVIDEVVEVLDLTLTAEGTLIGLAVSSERSGGFVLRSEDDGVTWTDSEVPAATFAITEASAGLAPSVILVAGDWLVAVRTGMISFGFTGVLYQQDVLVSNDDGRSWVPTRIATLPGTTPLVRTAIVVGDRLVLGGTTQVNDDPRVRSGDPNASFLARLEAFDAAVWIAADPAAGFQLFTPEFVGVEGNQIIDQIVDFDGRLVAAGGDSRGVESQCCYAKIAVAAWESLNGGTDWSPMDGLVGVGTPDEIRPERLGSDQLHIDGEDLVLTGLFGRFALRPGTNRWSAAKLELPFAETPGELRLSDGSLVLTWTINSACDCSIAFASRFDESEFVERELEFDDCQDESVRGDTRVQPPELIGETIVALATCNDRGHNVASLAFSVDDGFTWETTRLAGFAPDGSDVEVARHTLAADGALVALLYVTGTSIPTALGGHVVAIRVTDTT